MRNLDMESPLEIIENVKFSDLFEDRCQGRYLITRDQARQTVLEPDSTEVVTFDNTTVQFFTKRFFHKGVYFFIVCFGDKKGKDFEISLGFKILAELTNELTKTTPVLLLQALVQRFGLSLQIGNQINKFIMSETINIPKTTGGQGELVHMVNPKEHAFTNSSYIRFDVKKDVIVYRCLLAFAIDDTDYMNWLRGKEILSASVFLSYSRPDQKEVENIYRYLKLNGHAPYMDTEDLIGGENWEQALYKAIESSEIFIFCISNNSLERRGVLRKEVKRALEKLEGMLRDDIYIIPIRLEDCSYLEELKHLQAVDWFEIRKREKILESIQVAMKRRKNK
jgi:hypothetical protein